MNPKKVDWSASYENFDQKTNQLFNILSNILKQEKVMESAITQNLLQEKGSFKEYSPLA